MNEIKEILKKNTTWASELELETNTKELEAYINSHYIAKEKVEEKITQKDINELDIPQLWKDKYNAMRRAIGDYEKLNVEDEGNMEVARTRAIMGTAMASGYNTAVSEINKAVDDLVEDNK